MQVVLPGLLLPGPRRPGEVRLPVGRLGPRLATDEAVARRSPPVEVAQVAVLRRAGLAEPRVLVAGVVHDQVHHHRDAPVVGAGDQLVHLLQRPEQRLDVLVVADVVAVVDQRRAVDRTQPDDVHTEPLEVVEPADDPAQVTDPVAIAVGEALRVDLVDDRRLPPVFGSNRLATDSSRHLETLASRSQVSTTVSGLSDIDSMPASEQPLGHVGVVAGALAADADVLARPRGTP